MPGSLLGSLKKPQVLVVLLVLVASALSLSAAVNYFQVYLSKKEIFPASGRLLTALPIETNSWVRVGADQRETAEVEVTLGTTNYITRTYARKGPDGRPVPGSALQFHAAYYTGMIDTVPHVPDRCFVGGGMQLGEVVGDLPMALDRSRWVPDESVPEHMRGRIYRVRVPNFSDLGGTFVRLPLDPEKIEMRTMRFEDRGQSLYSGYFFIANGGHVARAEGVRLLAFDLRSEYAYYLKVQFTSSTVASGEELAKAASELLSELLPDIMTCVPDWVDVEEGRHPPREGPDRG